MRYFFRVITIMMLFMWTFHCYANKPENTQNNKTAAKAVSNQSKIVIKKYYETLLAQDSSAFLDLLSANVVHEINQGATEKGKVSFSNFIVDQFSAGKINIKDLIIMVSPDGKNAASRFICSGIYTKTEKGYPPAKGQHWELPIVTYFKIHDGKISHVAVYYNTNDYLKQISA